MTPLRTLSLGLGLAGLLACGGGSHPAGPAASPAYRLAYTNPTRVGVQLVKNASLSTDTHLVLDIVGSDPTPVAGIILDLRAEDGVTTWAKVNAKDADFVQNGDLLVLGGGTPILKGKRTGEQLQVVLSQKDYSTAVPMTGVLGRVALDIDPRVQSKGQTSVRTNGSGNCLLLGDGTIVPFEPVAGPLMIQ